MADHSQDEAIREIVDRLKHGMQTDENGKVEFTFGHEPTTFDFEDPASVAPSEEPVKAASAETTAPDEPRKAPAKKPKEPPQKLREEFGIPDTYCRVKNGPSAKTDPVRVASVYMPSFSDHEITYKMRDPSAEKPEAVNPPAPETEQDEQAEALATAEIFTEENSPQAISVETSGNAEPETAALNVFKFATPAESPKQPEVTEPASAEEAPEEPAPEEPQKETPAPEPEKSASEPQKTTFDFGREEENRFTDDTVPPMSAEKTAKNSHEFSSVTQRDAIKDRFLDLSVSKTVRLVASGLLMLLLIAFEMFCLFGAKSGGEGDFFGIPLTGGTPAIFDWSVCACLGLLAVPEIVEAFRRLISGSWSAELLLPAGILLLTVYDWTCFSLSVTTEIVIYPLLGSLYAAYAVVGIFGSLIRTRSDFLAFRVISARRDKKIVDRRETRTLEAENMALDGAIDESKSRISRVFRAKFVDGFFENTERNSRENPAVAFSLIIALCAGVLVGVPLLILNGWIDALSALIFVFLLSAPAAILVLRKIPYFQVQRSFAGRLGAVIGETALHENAKVDVVTYDDTEVFGKNDVNFKRIMLYGERENLPKAMKQMASLYLVVGGPLRPLFAFAMDRKPRPANGVVVEEDGIRGRVDGHSIASGTESYMIRNGFEIPEDPDGNANVFAESTRVLYAAEDGKVYAKFYIRYSFSEAFTSQLPALRENRFAILISTADPCITGDLLTFLIGENTDIRVKKRAHPVATLEPLYPSAVSDLVTLGDKNEIFPMLLTARKYVVFEERFAKASAIASGAFAALAGVLAVFDLLASPFLPLASLIHILGVGILALCGGRSFGRSRVTEQEENDQNEQKKEYHVTKI